jgi:hypothetical protein
MAQYVFPKTQILVRETNVFTTAEKSAADPNVYTCAVAIPANTAETNAVYTLEVYTDDKATGITTTVTVAGVAPQTVPYAASGVTADPSTLASAGGNTTVNVTFNTTPQA